MRLLILSVLLTTAIYVDCLGHEEDINREEMVETMLAHQLGKSNRENSKMGDMEDLLGRSRWCRKKEGICRSNKTLPTCPDGYVESPGYGRPYCMGRNRRCCHPKKTAVCSPQCINGNCTAPNTCTCEPGWEGPLCQNPVCSSKCINNGKCTSPNTCTCHPGWEGAQCQKGVCSEADGFFKVPGSGNKCFKYFTDSARSWEASKSKCHDEGLQLAKPDYAVALRNYIYSKFGNTHPWIGGHGKKDTTVVWIRDGSTLSSSESTWWPGYPGRHAALLDCLTIFGHVYGVRNFPTRPYYLHTCTETSFDNSPHYALCELVM